MKNESINLTKLLNWRVVYGCWILLAVFIQMIIMLWGFNIYTNLITFMMLVVCGTILGLLGLYWCWIKEWINAILMIALFPLQCIAYIVAVFGR